MCLEDRGIGQVSRNKFASRAIIAIFSIMLAENIRTLSKSEKLLLINELWENISEEVENESLSGEQNEMLDARYEAFLASPEEGMPWAEVKKNLKALL
ncbi:MAG: hypothetical protein EA353_02685 [Puniceicoccaceae bacterium]|nr:MAG: hypothetical protein EA353_02685 [Puniceicoccaceae bacterium]